MYIKVNEHKYNVENKSIVSQFTIIMKTTIYYLTYIFYIYKYSKIPFDDKLVIIRCKVYNNGYNSSLINKLNFHKEHVGAFESSYSMKKFSHVPPKYVSLNYLSGKMRESLIFLITSYILECENCPFGVEILQLGAISTFVFKTK